MPSLPAADEVEDFLAEIERVDSLVTGLKDGTVSVEQVDKLHEKEDWAIKKKKEKEEEEARKKEEDAKTFEERKKTAKVKVDEILARKQERDKAKEKFNTYITSGEGKGTFCESNTDYAAWDLWCPSDEEDEMLSTLPPSGPEFKAMEADIDARHAKMKDKMKTALKMKEAGNKAFKAGQYSEALKNYEVGLEADKRVIELQANAAQACLKTNCPVQCIDHCDQVMRLAEFFLEQPNHHLVPKALHRRGQAHSMLKNYRLAVQDFQRALEQDPSNKEIKRQLGKAELDLEEQKRERKIKRMLKEGKEKENRSEEGEGKEAPQQTEEQQEQAEHRKMLQMLGRTEQLVKAIRPPARPKKVFPKREEQAEEEDENSGTTRTKDNEKENVNQQGPNNEDGKEGAPEKKQQQDDQKDPEEEEAEVAAAPAKSPEERVAEVKEACQALRDLLGSSECRIHLRTCGGLEALAQHLTLATSVSDQDCYEEAGVSSEVRHIVLTCLIAACENDKNQDALFKVRGVLQSCLSQHLTAADPPVARCTLHLLYLCTTAPDTRRTLAATFRHSPKFLAQVLGYASLSGSGGGSGSEVKEDLEVVVWAAGLVSNCAVEASMRQALKTLDETMAQNQEGSVVGVALRLLSHPHPVVVEFSVNLVANLCNDPQWRHVLADHPQTVPALLSTLPPAPLQGMDKSSEEVAGLGLGLPAPKKKKNQSAAKKAQGGAGVSSDPSVIVAVLGALNNCLLSEVAQASVVKEGGVPIIVNLLSQFLPAANSAPTSAPTTTTTTALLRIVNVLGRAAKQSQGRQQMKDLQAISKIMSLVTFVDQQQKLPRSEGPKDSAVPKPSVEVENVFVSITESITRTLAICTAGDATMAKELLAAEVFPFLLRIASSAESSDGLVGNASLCVADSALDDAVLRKLSELNAVPPFIQIAHRRKGACQKNAAIALARMARDPKCLEKLRELHGIEIIHSYVKP